MNIGPSKIRIFSLLAFFLPLLFANTSCSRKQASPRVTLDFSSQNGSFNNAAASTIIVNLNSKVYHWECDRDDCSKLEFELENPYTGLLQLLILTEDDVDTTYLNYGDTQVDLKPGDNPVEINLSTVGNFSNESRLVGRYVPSAGYPMAGKYLTGEIEVYVRIPAKPDMKVMDMEIFGGWMNLFVLDTVGFKYRFKGQEKSGISHEKPIFTDLHDAGGLKLNSPAIQASTNVRVKFDSSEDFWDRRGNNLFVQRNFPTAIVGFFGDNPLNNRLCSKDLAAATVMDGSNGGNSICKASDGISCSQWYTWSDIIVSASSLNGSSDSCVGAPSNFIEVDIEDVGRGGGTDLIGVVGPFIEKDSVGQDDIVDINPDGSELFYVVDDNVRLPGGVEVFVRSSSSPFNRDDVRGRTDGIDCNLLKDYGFVSLGVKTANHGNRSRVAIPAAHASVFAAGQGRVALCPKNALTGEYFESAFLSEGNHGPATSGPGPAQVEFAIYLSDLVTPAPDFDFGGTNWSSSFPYIFPPTDTSSTVDMYLVIQNKLNEAVTISSAYVNTLVPGFTLVDNPASTPNSYNDCNAVGGILQGNDGAVTTNDICVVRVDFDGSLFLDGNSSHTWINIETHKNSNPAETGYSSVPVIGQTYVTFDPYNAPLNIDLYAPPGEIDSRPVKFVNNDPSNPWTHDLPASGGTQGPYKIHHNCPGSIPPAGSFCMVQFVLDNRAGSVTDATAVYSSHDFDFSMNTFSSTAFSGELVSSEGDPYDFGNITMGGATHNFVFTNNSMASVFIGPSSISGSYYGLGAGGGTDCISSPTLSYSNSCDIYINVSHQPSFGMDQGWFSFYYQATGAYRIFGFETLADHQP